MAYHWILRPVLKKAVFASFWKFSRWTTDWLKMVWLLLIHILHCKISILCFFDSFVLSLLSRLTNEFKNSMGIPNTVYIRAVCIAFLNCGMRSCASSLVLRLLHEFAWWKASTYLVFFSFKVTLFYYLTVCNSLKFWCFFWLVVTCIAFDSVIIPK